MDDETKFNIVYPGRSSSTIHHILRSSRRRVAVLLITDQGLKASPAREQTQVGRPDSMAGTTITVRDLARKITSIEHEIPVSQATGDSYHNTYTSLIQTHLPKLAKIGAINYDSDRKKLRPGPNLLAVTSVALTTSPLSTLLFQSDYAQGSIDDSISIEHKL